MPKKVEISHRTIIFTVFFLISLWFLFYIRDIIIQVFAAIFIMVILNPTVRKLNRWKIPRGLAVFIVYISTLTIFVLALASVVPALIEQTTNLANSLPRYLGGLQIAPAITDQISSELFSQVRNLPSQIIKVGVSVFSNFIAVVSVLIFAFYLLLSRDKIDDQLAYLIGEKRSKEVGVIIDELEIKLGGWARGQLALMTLVGVATYVGLFLLGIPYAVPLAIIAGLLEVVPYIGPNIAAIPAVIIGFGISPVMGFAVIALAFLIQQLEAYLLVPKVMERSAGINPIVTLLVLAVGFRLAGVVGILLSVPMFITLRVLVKHYYHKENFFA